MIFDIGPFQIYRVEKNGTLDVSLLCCKDKPWGWEYGWEDDMRGATKPLISFRIGKLVILYFERFKKGFEIWVLGFWWIA